MLHAFVEALRQDLTAFVFSAMSLVALVGLGEALRIRGHVTAERSRRVVHVGVGLFVAATPFLFSGPAFVYLLGVVFVGVNYVALQRGWFPGIHGTKRQSLGTVTFPLALLPALAVCWTADPGRLFALQIAFLILAFSDPLASLVGMHVARSRESHRGKTPAGSVAFIISAFAISLGALVWLKTEGRIDWTTWEICAAAVTVAGATTATEAFGCRGWDNFFIIQAAIVVLVVFDEHPASRLTLVGAALSGVAFGVVALKLRFLTLSGSIAGGLLAASVIGLGGWAWVVPSFAFFISSSVLSQVGKRRKAGVEAITEKGSQRDAGQVYANGGIGWVLLLIYALFPHDALYWGFLGAFAAATADTWGTEIGTLSRRKPRLITTGRSVPKGTSGAVSIVGTAGAAGGAVIVWISAWPFAIDLFAVTGVQAASLAVVVGGFLASLIDSVAGATVQARFRDQKTGQETERSGSGEGAFPLVRGWRWLQNDQVNWLCTLSGAILAMACFLAVDFAS
ncbi:MAG: DUF92 domain-containing protein [Rhodothermales bacterium]